MSRQGFGVSEFMSSSDVVTMSCSEHCSSCAQYSWIGKIESRKGERVGEAIKLHIMQNYVYHSESKLGR